MPCGSLSRPQNEQNFDARWSVLTDFVSLSVSRLFSMNKPAARCGDNRYSPSTRWLYSIILIILASSLCEGIKKNVTSITTTEEYVENYSISVSAADENETFSISFRKGDHFPTVVFPLGDTGQWLFPILFTAYMLLCLTIVCDFFLVPCIHVLSSRLEWSLDIAGATLMAFASSSPEMFVNILATFLTKNDVGVGTVLGTGLYALLLVPAFCILLNVNKTLKVDYWPIMRDSIAYFISMITLVVILMDNRIYWYEACSLIFIYFLYLIILYFSATLRRKFEACLTKLHRKKDVNGRVTDPLLPILSPTPGRLPVSMSVENVFNVLEDHTPEFCTISRWSNGRSLMAKVEWILMWPIITLFRLTIPTFWKSRYPQLCVITFTMCVAWIGLLCYGISWMISVIGKTFSLPETVLSLTLFAAGMSIPETVSGVIVANQGYGTMALCNALGSNTFAILMCLGVPWLINLLSFSRTDGYMAINSKGLEYSAILVAVALVLFFFIFAFNRFRLKRKSGCLLVILYLIFVSAGVYNEFQFFWRGN